VNPEEERKGCSGKDLQRRKVLSLERKSEWVMEYQNNSKYDALKSAYSQQQQQQQ